MSRFLVRVELYRRENRYQPYRNLHDAVAANQIALDREASKMNLAEDYATAKQIDYYFQASNP